MPEDSPLLTYIDWLKSHDHISAASAAHMINDAEEGWKYVADIPIGYGLGSSGAFVAALYDRYITKENSSNPSSDLLMLSKLRWSVCFSVLSLRPTRADNLCSCIFFQK